MGHGELFDCITNSGNLKRAAITGLLLGPRVAHLVKAQMHDLQVCVKCNSCLTQ